MTLSTTLRLTPRRLMGWASLALATTDTAGAVFRRTAAGHHGLLHETFIGNLPGGGRFLLLLSALLLFASLSGLFRGKRMAWLMALAAALVSLGVHPLRAHDPDEAGGLLALGIVLALAASWRAFPARSDPSRVRQGVAWLVGGELFVFAAGFAGLYLVDPRYVEPVAFSEAIENAVRLLFIIPSATVEPATRHGVYFIEAIRSLSIAVLAISAWHFVHPVLNRALVRPAERQRVRQLLAQYGSTALAEFHLLPDKTYYFAEDRRAFLSFRMAGSTAVALGEPVGAAESARQAARGFLALCALNGWRVVFHQVSEEGATWLGGMGLTKLKIGEEAIIPVQEFSLAGKSFKHERNVRNGLERDGYRVEELRQPLDEAALRALAEVSALWMADGGHRERSFTLGRFDADYLRRTRVFVVRRADGRIEAFANLLPRYASRDMTFDLMRRRPDSANGMMDALLLHFIDVCRAEGCDGLNLGLAPLANIEGSGPVAAALRLIYRRGDSAFNFRGLRDYKQKWNPRWEARYMVYRGELDLLPAVVAVARVGEEQGFVKQVAKSGLGRIGRKLRPA